MTMMPVPKNSIVETEELLGQELFLYDVSNGAVHTLNNGAAMVWLLCDGTMDLGAIAREIVCTCDLTQREVLAQVQETVGQFQALGLLEA